ncbi:MAG: HNH endonuclease [Sulfobacillus sp.]
MSETALTLPASGLASEPRHKQSIPAAIRRAVWNYYIGEAYGLGYCMAGCCGLISQTNFACGHVIAEKNGGRLVLENLRPICTTCNSSMGTNNLFDYMREHGLNAPSKPTRIIKVVDREDRKFCCCIP